MQRRAESRSVTVSICSVRPAKPHRRTENERRPLWAERMPEPLADLAACHRGTRDGPALRTSSPAGRRRFERAAGPASAAILPSGKMPRISPFSSVRMAARVAAMSPAPRETGITPTVSRMRRMNGDLVILPRHHPRDDPTAGALNQLWIETAGVIADQDRRPAPRQVARRQYIDVVIHAREKPIDNPCRRALLSPE